MNIYRKTTWSVAIALMIPCTVAAQERYRISGSAVDETDGEAVVNFYLTVRQDSTVVADALTDETGRFAIALPAGTYHLSGYFWGNLLAEKAIEVHGDVELPPFRVNTGLSLGEVQVTGRRQVIRREDNKLVFDVQSLASIGSYKVEDILRYVPRVSVDPVDGIRLGSKPAAVFLDGRRLSDEEILVYIRTLNAKDIDKIEMLQKNDGTQSADIRDGIINIITKSKRTGFDFTSHNRFAGTNADNGSLSPTLNAFWGKENLSLYAAYKFNAAKSSSRSTNTNNYLTDGIAYDEASWSKSKSYGHDFNIGAIVNIGKKSVFNINLNRNYTGGETNSLGSTLINDLAAGRETDHAARKRNATRNDFFQNIAASYVWTMDTLDSNLKIQYNHNIKESNSNAPFYSDYVVDDSRDVDETTISDAASENHSFRYDLRKNTAAGWSFRHGGQYLQSRRKSGVEVVYPGAGQHADRSDWQYDEKIAGAFVGISRTFGNKYLYGNIRAEQTILKGFLDGGQDDVNKNYTDFFPYLVFTHKINPKLSYDLRYSKSIYRPPFSLLNNYSYRASDNLYDTGNPDLEPEIFQILSAGMNYGNHSGTLSYIYSPNLIAELYTVVDGILYHTNANVGTEHTVELEYSYGGNLRPWWYLNFYLSGAYHLLPDNYVRKSAFQVTSSLNNKFSTPAGNIGLDVSYRNGVLAGNTWVEPRYYVNLSYNKSFRQMTLQAGINDIFNTNQMRAEHLTPYLEYLFYQKLTTRSLWLSLAYNFQTGPKVNKSKIDNQNTILNRL
jgi:hypothetical protein